MRSILHSIGCAKEFLIEQNRMYGMETLESMSFQILTLVWNKKNEDQISQLNIQVL